MFDEIAPQTVAEEEDSEVKLIKNIYENPQSFQEANHVQKNVTPSHKLQNHVYE